MPTSTGGGYLWLCGLGLLEIFGQIVHVIIVVVLRRPHANTCTHTSCTCCMIHLCTWPSSSAWNVHNQLYRTFWIAIRTTINMIQIECPKWVGLLLDNVPGTTGRTRERSVHTFVIPSKPPRTLSRQDHPCAQRWHCSLRLWKSRRMEYKITLLLTLIRLPSNYIPHVAEALTECVSVPLYSSAIPHGEIQRISTTRRAFWGPLGSFWETVTYLESWLISPEPSRC